MALAAALKKPAPGDAARDMPDDDEAEGLLSEPEARRFGGKKIVLFIVLPLLIIAAAVGAVIFSGAADGLLGRGEHATNAASKPAVFFDMPELLVNLNTGGRRVSFLKLSIALELTDPSDVPKMQLLMPRLIDSFQVYLRELRLEDLRGSAGVYRLREDLLARVNETAKPVKIKDVLFKEMLVQ